jgi:hypothetical protein
MIIIIMFLPAGGYTDICTRILEDEEPTTTSIQEDFTSSICSKKYKIDSVRGNILFEKSSDEKYTTELKNAALMRMFKKYTMNRTLDMSAMTLDVERTSSKLFAIYLQNEVTRWFFDKNELKDFRCVLVVPRMVHKHDNIEPNENISFSTEALIHRQAKNIGKHLLIEGEILQNKLHVNFIKIIGSIQHDNLFFDKFSTFSSTSAPYLSIYDYYQY